MSQKSLPFVRTAPIALLVAMLAAGPGHASKETSFSDFARVTQVEPVYRYVTINKPQRHCDYVIPQRRHQRPNQVRRFTSGESYGSTNINTDRSTFINHQNESIHGITTLAITRVTAALGSDIATDVANTRHWKKKRHAHSEYRTHSRSENNHRRYNERRNHNHGRNQSQRNGHNSHSNNVGYERCYTTTVSYQERQLDGYTVTYVYRGNTFQTRTAQHPGKRIRIRVQLRPH